MKKKVVVFLLCSVMALGTASGLGSCKGNTSDSSTDGSSSSGQSSSSNSTQDSSGTSDSSTGGGQVEQPFVEGGKVYNPVTAKDYKAARTDARVAAYTAYTPEGTKIGDYKALANAINAAIENDAAGHYADESYEFGSYVTQKNGTKKMFVSRQGYQQDENGKVINDECFWYYENGTSLDAFDCYNEVDTVASLKNSKYIVARQQSGEKTHDEENTGGLKATQGWNSYGVLDKKGEYSTSLSAAYYELSATLDAAVIAMPQRFSGNTKMTYTIDLSDVKITPSYTTGNEKSDVYAFMGYYAWQDWYVLNFGIACDVTTGNWYAYEGSSRDDSASNTTYNLGDCIMTSTWNEAGYFEPDADEVVLSIESKLLEDDMGEYQVDDFTAAVKDGAIYKRRITDEDVNTYFPTQQLNMENSYVFVAGLDIKNEISMGVRTENTDYFNGAKFENFAVTKAEAYVPTEEELSDVDYSPKGIEPAYRGKTFNMLLGDPNRKDDDLCIIDYNILNNNLCTTFQVKDGKNIYNFSYDMTAAGSPELGTKAKEYQDTIDNLKNATVENVSDYEDDINLVATWYGDDADGTNSQLQQKFRNIMDFAPYMTAKEILASVMDISDDAKAVAEDFGTLGNLASYAYKGWTTDGTDVAGYLYSELGKFRTIRAAYDALDATDKAKMGYHMSLTIFNAWVEFDEDVKAFETNAAYSDEGIKAYLIGTGEDGGNTPGEEIQMTPAKALEKMAEILFTVKSKGQLLNWDNNFQSAEFIYVACDYLDGLGIEIPQIYVDMIGEMGDETLHVDYYALQATVRLGSKWIKAAEDPLLIKQEIEEADLAILNKYFVNSWTYSDGGIVWGFGGNEWVFGGRLSNLLQYNSEVSGINFMDCLNKVMEVLVSQGYTKDTLPYRVTESAIEAKTGESMNIEDLTAEQKAFYDAWLNIGNIESFRMKGWKAGADVTDTTGYLVDTAEKIADLKAQWEGFETEEQDKIAAFLIKDAAIVTAEIAGWTTFNTELGALKANAAFTGAADLTTLSQDATDTEITLTSEGALGNIAYWALAIKNGGRWEGEATLVMDNDNSWFQSAYIVTLVEYVEGLGVELPTFIQNVLTAIKYDNYFTAFDSIRSTVAIAVAIQSGSLTSLDQLSAAQLASLNQYWVSGYTIHSFLSWNWVNEAGNQFETYYQGRVGRVVKLAGGAIADGSNGAKAFQGYVKVLGDFLTANGYTVDAEKKGWGVTETAITVKAEA